MLPSKPGEDKNLTNKKKIHSLIIIIQQHNNWILVRTDSSDTPQTPQQCSSRIVLVNIWARWAEKLLWNETLMIIQKSRGKLHRKGALKSVPSVIFTSCGGDGLFVLATACQRIRLIWKPSERRQQKLKDQILFQRGFNDRLSLTSEAILKCHHLETAECRDRLSDWAFGTFNTEVSVSD